MTPRKRSSGTFDPRLAPTKPDMPRMRPLEEAPASKPDERQDGRYSLHFGRDRRKGLQKLVEGLSSPRASERASSASALKEYVGDAKKAREVSSMLPPGKGGPKALEEIRGHCQSLMGKKLR